MAFEFTDRYAPEIERHMRSVYQTMGEKERRRYAAIEAVKLPHGGVKYISDVLGVSRRTIKRGIQELEDLPDDPAGNKQRRPGGGRPAATEAQPELEDNLYEILDFQIGGDPDDPGVLFTHRSSQGISEELAHLGTPVGPATVKGLLNDLGVSQRKIAKSIPGGFSPDRDRQFEHIAELREEFIAGGDPVFSIDTKAKEYLGRMYREGRAYRSAPATAFDHDYPDWADGRLVPHGIYDLARNHGHLNLGLSADTSEFACESFLWYWQHVARSQYPSAKRLLWLCDAGGSNSCRYWIFKQDLEALATKIGLPIRVAHYPSYCSKYNPIERRFFPHVGRACAGMLFDTLETAANLMRQATTRTGLSTTVHIIDKIYEKGRQVRDKFRQTARLFFEPLLPTWNYTVLPETNATVIS